MPKTSKTPKTSAAALKRATASGPPPVEGTVEYHEVPATPAPKVTPAKAAAIAASKPSLDTVLPPVPTPTVDATAAVASTQGVPTATATATAAAPATDLADPFAGAGADFLSMMGAFPSGHADPAGGTPAPGPLDFGGGFSFGEDFGAMPTFGFDHPMDAPAPSATGVPQAGVPQASATLAPVEVTTRPTVHQEVHAPQPQPQHVPSVAAPAVAPQPTVEEMPPPPPPAASVDRKRSRSPQVLLPGAEAFVKDPKIETASNAPLAGAPAPHHTPQPQPQFVTPQAQSGAPPAQVQTPVPQVHGAGHHDMSQHSQRSQPAPQGSQPAPPLSPSRKRDRSSVVSTASSGRIGFSTRVDAAVVDQLLERAKALPADAELQAIHTQIVTSDATFGAEVEELVAAVESEMAEVEEATEAVIEAAASLLEALGPCSLLNRELGVAALTVDTAALPDFGLTDIATIAAEAAGAGGVKGEAEAPDHEGNTQEPGARDEDAAATVDSSGTAGPQRAATVEVELPAVFALDRVMARFKELGVEPREMAPAPEGSG